MRFRHTQSRQHTAIQVYPKQAHQCDSDILKADNTLRFRYTQSRHTSAIQAYAKQTHHSDSDIPEADITLRFGDIQSRHSTDPDTFKPDTPLRFGHTGSNRQLNAVRTYPKHTSHCDSGILKADARLRFGHTLSRHSPANDLTIQLPRC